MKRLFARSSVAVLAVSLSPAAFSDPVKVTADQFTLKLISENPAGFGGQYAPVLQRL